MYWGKDPNIPKQFRNAKKIAKKFKENALKIKMQRKLKKISKKEVRNYTPKHYSKPDQIINHLNTTELKTGLKLY